MTFADEASFERAEDGGMKRDLPFSVQEELVEETPRSMLASRTVWIGGVLSLAFWGVLAAWFLR